MNRRDFVLASGVLALAVPLLQGCAGDLGAPTGLLTGAVTFRVNWGTSTATKAVLMLATSDGKIISKILERTPGSASDSLKIDKVALGPASFQGDFIDPNNITLSTVTKLVQVTANTLIEVSVFTIPPDRIILNAGQTIPVLTPAFLSFTAFDKSDNLASVPLILVSYASSDVKTIETIDPDTQKPYRDSNGKPFVKGLKFGTANITVTVAVPGTSISVSSPAVPVTVVQKIGLSPLVFTPVSPVTVATNVTVGTTITMDTTNAGIDASLVLLPDRILQPAPTITTGPPSTPGTYSITIMLPALTTPGVYQLIVTSKSDSSVSQNALLVVTAGGVVTFQFP